MRAGPLSNSEVINTLNEKFVNTWVLLRELPELIDGAKGDGARLVATRLQQNYTDSVDMLVLSPIGDVVAHQPEMALPYRNRDKVYLSLLGRSLAAYESKHQLNSEPINLGRKLKEVSRTFRASGTNTHDYTHVEINTSSIDHDGILYIKIQVGRGEAVGRFELFDSDTDLTTEGFTDEALTGTWNVPPGGTGHIFHRFRRGQHFKLAARSPDSKGGNTNAFLASIYVVQEG